jgi:DNA-binding Lrp family transcriptional regulator
VKEVVVAYSLIQVETGAKKRVVEALRRVPEVKEAFLTDGVYDIVARIEKESIQGLRDIVTSKIWGLNNLRLSETMVCVTP